MPQDIDSGQSVIEDIVLAACELWLGTSAVNQENVVKMLKEGFKPEEAKSAPSNCYLLVNSKLTVTTFLFN